MDIILDKTKQYTYADYLTWLDGKRRELLNGLVHLMSPAPTLSHAKISRKIFARTFNYIDKHKGKCQVFSAPFDVRLSKDGETADDKIYTVVQPDICIICDESKLEERGCLGAPDMIVEILSPSTRKYDLNDKFNLYELAGVKEYWVVSPKEKDVNVFILQDNGKYDVGTLYESDQQKEVPVKTLPGLVLTLNDIFEV
ncbi:Uma2 family endonuclease [Bacteroides sp. 519]|uniref:Uma2 family endonuclease n=1 Tax=Bacteroides sp. 519 TaxID=2302937 RepID=UPI0013D5F0FD|nr:Uma2 family endonuclease [Bacteroides sp. 519]NDV58352.1 Uma2 family endonuclease [Bacteroides sp. 519]